MTGAQHVVITGATRGIGFAVADAFLAQAATVSIVGRDRSRLDEACAKLSAKGSVRPICVDVSDPDGAKAAVDAAEARQPVTVLVNNAGAVEARRFEETTPSHWEAAISANLYTAINCARELLPAMRSRGAGAIVNMASTAGLYGYRMVSPYAAAKHALIGWTRSLALELKDTGVGVCAVCPGYVETEMLRDAMSAAAKRTGREEADMRRRFAEMNEGGRLIDVAEVAAAVVKLAGDPEANGTVVVIDGS